MSRLRERRKPTIFKWTKGHNGNPGNDGADNLAGQESRKHTPDEVNTTIPHSLQLSGAKLQSLTQSKAYKIIQSLKMAEESHKQKLNWKQTKKNLRAFAQEATEEALHFRPSPNLIWKSIRSKDIPHNIQSFLWMTLHDGYKIGHYWDNIQNHKDRGICKTCDVHETMQHILTQCRAPGQEQIWKMALKIWQLKNKEDLHPTVGQLFAYNIPQPKKPKGDQTELNNTQTTIYTLISPKAKYDSAKY